MTGPIQSGTVCMVSTTAAHIKTPIRYPNCRGHIKKPSGTALRTQSTRRPCPRARTKCLELPLIHPTTSCRRQPAQPVQKPALSWQPSTAQASPLMAAQRATWRASRHQLAPTWTGSGAATMMSWTPFSWPTPARTYACDGCLAARPAT